MTVRSKGFNWWRQLVDRYKLQMFRRVMRVYLHGTQYKSDLLPELAKLNDLRELESFDTSISDSDLEAWSKQHPHVVVTATHNMLAR